MTPRSLPLAKTDYHPRPTDQITPGTCEGSGGDSDSLHLPKKVDLIWNNTRLCPWDCRNCCVDAYKPKRVGNEIEIISAGLSVRIPYRSGEGNQFEQGLAYLQHHKIELNLAQKMKVLDHLAGFDVKLDISGGDALSVAETLEVMKVAADRLGRERVTLTATGAGLVHHQPEDLARLIGEYNFTYDNVTSGNEHRPAGYANGNLKIARRFREIGAATRAECPLSVFNVQEPQMRQIYLDLHDADVDKLLLMRLFPVGRGTLCADHIPTEVQYRFAIDFFREMEAKYRRPAVKLQCALRYFDNRNLRENPCDLARESFGLMADGTLLASPWAYNDKGAPLGDEWILGNLAQKPLREILLGDKARYFYEHINDNFGHCKIFAWRHSARPNPIDRIFDRSDPLYNPDALATGIPPVGETGRRTALAVIENPACGS